MAVVLQVVGIPNEETTASICLHTERKTYLFNCGESTQRLCIEQGLGFRRLTEILTTSVKWDNIGGLPGMLLTVTGAVQRETIVRGPEALEVALQGCMAFTHPSTLLYDFQNVDSGVEIVNDDVTFLPIEVKSTPDRSTGDLRGEPEVAVAWVCKVPAPPKLNWKKAMELGVPKGPMFGSLQRGESVVLPNGTIVTSAELKDPNTKDLAFLILECPSKSFVDSVVANTLLQSTLDKWDANLVIIFHIAPSEVFEDDQYNTWMKSFPETVNHVILTEQVVGSKYVFNGAVHNQGLLNIIDPETFPLPYQAKPDPNQWAFPKKKNFQPGASMLQYKILPVKSQGFDYSKIKAVEEVDFRALRARVEPLEGFAEALNSFTQQSPTFIDDSFHDESELFMLGTGASLPSRCRNVSANLLKVDNGGTPSYMLLDCGEGTYGQLFRLFGKDLDAVVMRIRIIWISHMHADHHLGLVRLLIKRNELMGKHGIDEPKPLVIGPSFLQRWLQSYGGVQHLDYLFLDARCIRSVKSDGSEVQDFDVPKEMGLELLAVPVRHGGCAAGLVISHNHGWRVVYSGDTRPCEALSRAGKDATVLIHEATFEEALPDLAVEKNHSTSTEALQVGHEMNADLVLLTHFSQRYPRCPVYETSFTDKTALAFDHTRFKLKERARLPKLLPLLKIVFDAEELLHNRTDEKVVEIAFS